MSSVLSSRLPDTPSSRWLAISLALNLFFVSIAGALLARHYLMPQTAARAPIDRSIGARTERIAATLPQADAEIMRSLYRAQAATIEPRQEAYRRLQDRVRQTLRAQPFDADAMRAAMTEARSARRTFHQSVQDFMVATATAMSPAGRNKLADWPPSQRSGSTTNR
jgi:uncharacterized membrane protein